MIIKLETAILANEKGFDNRPQSGYYHSRNYQSGDSTYYPACTQTELQTWLRDKKGIHVYSYLNAGKDGYNVTIELINIAAPPIHIGGHETYNNSFEYGLFNALSLCE